MMKMAMITLISILFVSCGKPVTIFGVYENQKGEKVTIGCDYRIHSDKLEGQTFMPYNGDEITLSTNKIGAVEFSMDYRMGDTMQSSFGTWNKVSGEMKINGASYLKKEEITCE